MKSTLVAALTGGALMALLASAPDSVADNSSHPRTVKSAVVRAPKGTPGSHMSTWHRYPVVAGQRRWVGGRHYGAAYYDPDYGTAYYQPGSSFAQYAPADSDAVLGAWPVSPPVPAADPPPHRVVQFPVTIFYEYHPHWTVNPF